MNPMSEHLNPQLVEALRPVEDPELHRSIVDLGMLRRAELDSDGTAHILVALTVAGCPLRNEIQNRVTGAATTVDGVNDVQLEFTVMTDDEREALGLAPSEAVFSIERLGISDGRPIEWRHTIIRGDRFTFVADWTAGQRNELRLEMVSAVS